MRITRAVAAGAVLAVAAACGQQQRPATGPAPDFEYVAINSGQTACGLAYGKKGDTTAVLVGEVEPRGVLSFTVREPERGADYVLHANCGGLTYTEPLRPRRRSVAFGSGPQRRRVEESQTSCGPLSRYTPQTPHCGIPNAGPNSPSTRRGDGPGNGGSPSGTDPTVAPGKNP